MDSKEPEELRNDTGTDDTVAWNKKRGRRVSFAAEITSVHVFDRDEDLQTPPDTKQDSDTADVVLRFTKDLDDSDDFRQRNDGEIKEDDDVFGRQPFLQPFKSPSPGSAIGSATSNDEDDFFGPVSLEFIRPGRLSDSAASDDNHEITMDSTAFSMHFLSLARSESGDLKTPTGPGFVFEEKTPTQSGTTIMQGSTMELTGYEKPVPHISIPVDEFGSGKDSNDMNLVEDNPHKYDYATISPRLNELMSEQNKFLHGVPTSESSDAIDATNYLRRKSNTTWIQSGSTPSKDAQATDLGNPNVHDSDTDARFPLHLLVSDSPQYHGQATEWPNDDTNLSSSQHDLVPKENEDLGLNHMEAYMASIRSGKPSELSSPIPSIGLSTQIVPSHIQSRDDMLKQSETTHTLDIAYQKFQSDSPAIPHPLTLVGQRNEIHGDGKHKADTVHSTGMHVESPLVSITSPAIKAQLSMDAVNSSGLRNIIPSKELGGCLLNQAGTDTDVKHSSKRKVLPLKPNGVSSSTCTPIVGDSSIRSKLFSCIVKTPQHDIPVSRLEDRFYGTDQGKISHQMTADVDGNEFMPSEKLGDCLVNQAISIADVRYSKENSVPRLKIDIASFSGTPLVGDSSIRSKLSSCIVKTPQHAIPVCRLEDQFLGIDQGESIQEMTADVDDNKFMTPKDQKDLLTDAVVKAMATGRISCQSASHVEEGPHRLSSVGNIFEGSMTRTGTISSSLRVTHHVLSGKKLTRTPDRMVYSQNQSLIAGMSPPDNGSSHSEPSSYPHRLNHDVVHSYHSVTDPSSFEVLDGNTYNKSNDTLGTILPSQKSSVFRSLSTRDDGMLHVDLNRQIHSDKAIRKSPGKDGDSMEIISSGNYLNAVAQKLDNLFLEKNLYSVSPLFMIDQLKSPLLARPLLSEGTNGMMCNTGMLQTPLKNDTISSAGGNIGSSGWSFTRHAHASADESPSMALTTTKESSLGTLEKKAPNSSVHKRRRGEVVTANELSTPNLDNPKSPKIQKNKVNESLKQNGHSEDDQSRIGSRVTIKDLSDILSEVRADSEQLHLASVERLGLQKVELLEDVVIQLQKAHSVSRICTSIQTQSVGNQYSQTRNRRISETKELLEKMLYDQAKLKLLCAKRDKLLKRVDIIRSGIKDCQTMKNCSQLRECVERNAKAVTSDPQSLTSRFEDQQNFQVTDNEILKMRQKVDATQRDIDSLIYSFHTCFKIKEKSNNIDSITLINDYFKRRALFKSLGADVQLWEISDLVYNKGKNQINLNYHGYLTQRFTLIAPISAVTVSYMLRHQHIEKKYPNMDAHIAFSSAFKEDVEQKYVGIRSLAQETQVASSILSSLLDVIEEVMLARLDVKHLKEARFLSPSAGKLDLCLHFFDFKTAKKINMALDVSCLTRGIYPADVLPSPSMLSGVQAALENLKVGFSRIIRICRCISEALESSS